MKTILHLCADIGSDSRPYQLDSNYKVVMIGKEIGVENYSPNEKIHGIIANPVCKEFSTIKGFDKSNDIEKGMFLVEHCQRIIREASPVWWVLENPANGRLKEVIGKPKLIYQPWQYGSPWTKKTALWGNFNIPKPLFEKWEDVPKNNSLYVRPNRQKPQLAFFHKSAAVLIPEFEWAKDKIKTDSCIRSMCSFGFATEFKKYNP